MQVRGRRILVCGGAGFIGSAFCRVAKLHGYEPVVLDRLTYAGDRRNVLDVCPLFLGDIALRDDVLSIFARVLPDAVVSFAACSHVDRAIHESMDPFIDANVRGVQVLLDACRGAKIPFISISSDEAYGPAPPGVYFAEDSQLRPGNGYSATKAAGDLLCKAAFNTYGTEVVVTRCVNNYGPRQYVEKLIANTATRALAGQSIPVHGRGHHVRDWIFVDDHCEAVLLVLEEGEPGEIYNIATHDERTDLDVVRAVLRAAGASEDLIEFVEDRPGADLRYGVTNAKVKALGWTPQVPFDAGIARTVAWYRENEEWWRRKVSF